MAPAIDLLPPELLSEILQRVVNGPNAHRYQHVRYLSHVNRRWRCVALDTPQLWTTIVTKAPFDGVYDFDRIRLWIERSKALPITFVLRDMEKGAARSLVDIFKLLGPTVETIFFEPGHYWPLDRMLGGLSTTLSFPRLKYLRSNGTHSLVVITRHFMGVIPSMKQLSITLRDIRGRDMIKETWKCLTTLHASFLDGQSLSRLFDNAKFLQHFSFATNTSTLQVQRTKRHEALRSLFVRGYGPPTEDFGDYFPSFPKLEHLGLYACTVDGTPGHPSLSRLFHACGSTLRYLELYTVAMDIAQFTHCLSLAPGVRFLHLYGGVTELVIEALIFRPDTHPILPQLEVLSLSNIHFKQDSLWKVAISRVSVSGVVLPRQPSSAVSSSILPDLSVMQIGDPPLRRPLRYITMSEFAGSHQLQTRFGWTKIRMRDHLGIALKIIGVGHHTPRKDAVELLGISINEAAQWDWKDRDYVSKPTW